MRKRILSLLLGLVLCVGLMTPAAAASYTTVKVEAGFHCTYFLNDDGVLYGCGRNNMGQLSSTSASPDHGDSYYSKPVKLTEDVVDMAASIYESSQNRGVFHSSGGHVLVLKEGGKLYVMGANDCGQFGLGDRNTRTGLHYVMGNVEKIAAGATSSAAITTNGDLYYWGLMMQHNSAEGNHVVYYEPTKLMSGVQDVALGSDHMVVLTTGGDVYTMGNGYEACLGNGTDSGYSYDLVKVFSGCVDVAAANQNTIALKADGSLYIWGTNGSCQMGLPAKDLEYAATPRYITNGVKAIDGGMRTIYYLKNDNTLWSMGWNMCGERGLGVLKDVKTTQKIASNVADFSAGYLTIFYTNTSGVTYAAGNNFSYQFGNGKMGYDNPAFVPVGFSVSPFADVSPASYCYSPVRWAVDMGITNGTTATTFSPNATCTRGQIITFLYRAAGSPAVSGSSPFSDVESGSYCYNAALWAYKRGMVEGDTFSPNAPCTRAMAVEFMWKQAGSPKAPAASFTDVSADADYAQAVNWALDAGVTTGTTATTFAPTATCTRGQIATFLYRAFAE